MTSTQDVTLIGSLTARAASALIAHDSRRRTALAMRDPAYAEIEHRRVTTGTARVLFSDDDALTWNEWCAQRDTLAAISERPWIPISRWFAARPGRNAAAAVVHGAQRLQRGWDDTALWSLHDHVCTTLAGQLDALASTANGWPDSAYETFELWQVALRTNAAALAAYGTRTAGPAFQHWDSVLADATATPDTRNAALDAALAEERAATLAAQDALRWVADMLPNLWD